MEKRFEFDVKNMNTTRMIFLAVYFVVSVALSIIYFKFHHSDGTVFKIISGISLILFLYVFSDLLMGLYSLIFCKTIKNIEFFDEYFTVNDDKFFYSDDSLTSGIIGRSSFALFFSDGYSLRASDENAGVKKIYWAGPVLNKKTKALLEQVKSAFRNEFEKQATGYTDNFYEKSSNSSSSHIVVSFPVGKNQSQLRLSVYTSAAVAIFVFVLSLFMVKIGIIFLMFMLCLAYIIFMFTVCLRRYLFYMKNGITTAEISPKGIRINNDFYSFDLKPDFSYIDHPNKADKIKLATPYKHLIVKTADGRTSVYSLGFYHLGYREQKLMITSIDRIMRYIEAYGVPKD